MAQRQRIDWSSLWKKDEWLAVWLGFLIIVLLIAGLPVKTPSFRWTTDGEFASFAVSTAPQVEMLVQAAGDKGEKGVQDQAVALKAVVEQGDRKASGDAGRKLEETAKAARDSGVKKKASDIGKNVSGQAGRRAGKVFSWANIWLALQVGIAYLILSIIAMALMGESAGGFTLGFPIVFAIAWIGQLIAGNYSVLEYGLEYVLWCLFLGLFISNVLGIPGWLKAAVKTEFYIKTGLVILGANILFGEIVQAGAYGLVQAVLVVAVVWYLTFWVCKKFQVDDEFAAMLSSGVSICRVSAAIATSGAVKGDPKKLSYVTSVVLIRAVPMMVLQPIISKALGIPDVVAGAWLGGTLDTSGSVVAAGAMISESAMKTGVIVKMSQNVLIGFVAFILSIVWTFKKAAEMPGAEKPSAMEIWFRFPKFVLGFMIASVLFSFLEF